jgi:hypothetical protein
MDEAHMKRPGALSLQEALSLDEVDIPLRTKRGIRRPRRITKFEKGFNAFHLTSKWLGDSFIPRLQVPHAPYEDAYGNVIEDETTPRMSVAPTIQGCLRGLGEEGVFSKHYVYAAKDAKLFKPFGRWCPKSPGNRYGPNFSWKAYVEHNKEFDKYGDEIRWYDEDRWEALENCVPDQKYSNEHWITEANGIPRFFNVGWVESINGQAVFKVREDHIIALAAAAAVGGGTV